MSVGDWSVNPIKIKRYEVAKIAIANKRTTTTRLLFMLSFFIKKSNLNFYPFFSVIPKVVPTPTVLRTFTVW
jgi:hypothetical protein